MEKEKTSKLSTATRLLELIARGHSKSDIARMAGVSRQAVTGWCITGRISKEAAIRLANATGVSLSWLLGEQVDEHSGLRPKEREVLEIFNQLPENEQEKMISAFKLRLQELDDFVEKYITRRKK
ncbi:helix-turn-helix domain-containing protein [Symbiopectobacterium purcellii]|uniref:Helix-turn-helix domain-containing protein n=1 Tax=Symbiopectobacterium purcellii TaxID=2871826 RepID=A0ABX9ATJ8_9ENTR|nr:helix-turn-helix domain-containing protein [Symbiopectobacterium purcellii]QZN97326.1 helix-turn-helix domain-containing protein [Symbiopectobacterium purcellii]